MDERYRNRIVLLVVILDKLKLKNMKKLLFLCLLLLTACADQNPDGSLKLRKASGTMLGYPFEFVMDSCEYVMYDSGIAHKGSCKFCVKREEERIRRILREEFK